MKSEKHENSCFRSKKVKLKKFIPHRWLAEEIIAWQFLLWYYGIGCRKMPDTKKKVGRQMDRNVNIITDLDGTKIVLINDIVFRGKRSVKWKDVEQYLRQYIGEFYTVADTEEIVYIGSDLPDEYVHSNYTKKLRGTSAKAKANAAQGLPEMIETATGKQFEENRKEKHGKDAKYGWYRYESRFALPVYDENGEVERYNVFHALMLMRHAKDGNVYLYDIMEIKKETSRLFQSGDLTQ